MYEERCVSTQTMTIVKINVVCQTEPSAHVILLNSEDMLRRSKRINERKSNKWLQLIDDYKWCFLTSFDNYYKANSMNCYKSPSRSFRPINGDFRRKIYWFCLRLNRKTSKHFQKVGFDCRPFVHYEKRRGNDDRFPPFELPIGSTRDTLEEAGTIRRWLWFSQQSIMADSSSIRAIPSWINTTHKKYASATSRDRLWWQKARTANWWLWTSCMAPEIECFACNAKHSSTRFSCFSGICFGGLEFRLETSFSPFLIPIELNSTGNK